MVDVLIGPQVPEQCVHNDEAIQVGIACFVCPGMELAEVDDYDDHLAKIKERLNRLRSPYRSAEFFEIEEIIDPRQTRAYLCKWAKLARAASRPEAPQFWYRP